MMFMSTANQFIDPNVYWSTILRFIKNVSLKKTNSFPTIQQKCNKLMNDSCFKAQKEFDKAKQEFCEISCNMCSQIIVMISKNSTR